MNRDDFVKLVGVASDNDHCVPVAFLLGYEQLILGQVELAHAQLAIAAVHRSSRRFLPGTR